MNNERQNLIPKLGVTAQIGFLVEIWLFTIHPLHLKSVSETNGGEYEQKKFDYAQLGILYYPIYLPTRQHHHQRQPLEVYPLEKSK